MSTLMRRAALTLGLLFGLMFAVGVGLMFYLNAPVYLALVFAIVIVGAQYLAGPLIIDSVFAIRWVAPEEVSPEFSDWFYESCASAGIAPPRFGIIADGNPNAFTYGRTRGDARLVVTSGLIDILSPAELKAVVSHEIGHVRNRDFIVMTVAQAVPLVLYILYVWTRDRGRGGAYTFVISIGAYLVYLFSQYVVLSLSRVRELFADERSAEATRDPNSLASALIKICYGLWKEQDRIAQAGLQESGSKKKKTSLRTTLASNGIASLGIANVQSAGGFALSASDSSGSFSPNALAKAIQWDLENPWAKWFQLNSTHPLTATRIVALSEAAARLGIEPEYSIARTSINRDKGSFFAEFLIYGLPALLMLVAVAIGSFTYGFHSLFDVTGWGLIGFGTGWFIKNAMIYPELDDGLRTIESLVAEEAHASPVKAVPCAIEGEIIGRGVPGAFWSHDLVLRDDTGMMRLQYRQPLGVLEFLFGWLKAANYVKRRVRVVGWYRRSTVPYLEISKVEIIDGWKGNVCCYYHLGAYFVSIGLVLLGLYCVGLL